MTDEQIVSKYLKSLPADLSKSIDELSPMSVSQRASLLTLIADKKPRKILETGILAGARTVELANCIKCNNIDAILFSVDPTEKYYADASKETGFLVRDLFNQTDIDDNYIRLFIGNIVNEVLPSIGNGIDLLILDSFGMAPGEISNMVACLPYLSKDCTVVLPRTKAFIVLEGLPQAIANLGLSEQAAEELLESNSFFVSQAIELRRSKALVTHKYKHRQDDLAFTKRKLDSAKEGLEFYKAQAKKAQEGLEFYKELLKKKEEGLDFYRSQLENREEKLQFYKKRSEAKNRELERLRAQMDSQDEQLANMENSLAWRISSRIGSAPRHHDK